LEGGDEFGLGIESDPDPEIVGLVPEGGVELIELEMANLQIAEEVRVHFFGVGASAGEPEAQGGVGMAEKELDIGHGETEIDSQEYSRDVPGGGVEAIEGGTPAAGEAGLASLAAELLNPVAAAIGDKGMERGIGIAPILTEQIRAGVASGADLFRGTLGMFALWPGEHPWLVGVAPKRFWMGSATNGAIVRRARLQGARFSGEREGVIAQFSIPRQ
jgi:hypothetical protein